MFSLNFQWFLAYNRFMSETSGPQIYEGHYIPKQIQPESGIKTKIIIQLLLALFCVAGLVFAGYYFGKQSAVKPIVVQLSPSASSEEILQSAQPTIIPSQKPVSSNSAQIFPVPSTIPLNQTISINLNNKSYSLKAPEGWKLSQEIHNYSTQTRITNDQHALIIATSAAAESEDCLYQNDDFVQFMGVNKEIYRRLNHADNSKADFSIFDICQKSATKDSFSKLTDFGFISYEFPYDANAQIIYKDILATLDTMVANLKIK